MAKILKEGNYKLPDWKIVCTCTGNGWGNRGKKPCYSTIELEDGDIFKRKCYDEFYYGFICPQCSCFTEIDSNLLPYEVKNYAPQVAAKGSDEYSSLTEQEKKLSEKL